nr:hypothetical protein CFP56_33576 [Quercus suber]
MYLLGPADRKWGEGERAGVAYFGLWFLLAATEKAVHVTVHYLGGPIDKAGTLAEFGNLYLTCSNCGCLAASSQSKLTGSAVVAFAPRPVKRDGRRGQRVGHKISGATEHLET